jgi:hypothetical protein
MFRYHLSAPNSWLDFCSRFYYLRAEASHPCIGRCFWLRSLGQRPHFMGMLGCAACFKTAIASN